MAVEIILTLYQVEQASSISKGRRLQCGMLVVMTPHVAES